MTTKFDVTWRLRECMHAAGISTATELHNRIKEIAPDAIKYAQLARIIEKPPERLNMQTLVILTIVLKCTAGDILDEQPGKRSTQPMEAEKPVRKRKKRIDGDSSV